MKNERTGGLAGATTPAAYSIADFCKAHSISRSMFYILERDGAAPRLMRIGKRKLISQEAAADWRRERETMNA